MLFLFLACAARAPAPAPAHLGAADPAAPAADAAPAAPAAAAEGSAPVPPVARAVIAERVRAALAAEDPEAWTPLRATVANIGPFELAPGRRVFSPEPTHPFDAVVVSDEGAVVRVLHESADIRVVVGVRREDLADRPDDRAPLAPSPGAAVPEGAYVHLAGGTPVALGTRTADAVRVTWTEDGVALDGWAPAAEVGPVWAVTRYLEEEFWSDLRLVDPTGGDGGVTVALRDAPDGNVLATLHADAWLPMRSAGAPVGEWRPVELRGKTLRARGWVRRAEVEHRERVAMGYGSGGGAPPLRDMRIAELAAGVWLSPEGAAEPFARAARDAQAQLVVDDGTRLRVRFRSAWGWLPGEVDCPRRSAPESKTAEVRCEP